MEFQFRRAFPAPQLLPRLSFRRCSANRQKRRPIRHLQFSSRCRPIPAVLSRVQRLADNNNRKIFVLFLVIEEVDGVLFEIFPSVIIAHHGLRVAMPAHHLHLPVSQPLIQCPGDRRPPQIVRRDFTDAGEFAPFTGDIPDHRRRERFIEHERAVIGNRLERPTFIAAVGFENRAPVTV